MKLQLPNVSDLLILLFRSLCKDIEIFFSAVLFFLQTFLMILPNKWNCLCRISNTPHQDPCNGEISDGQERISVAEMNVAMSRLGMVCRLEEVSESRTSFGARDLASLFEEEEPSFDEIKDAFKVFDVNNDGFIDASELRRVVCSLGLKEGCEFEECKKMIEAFDGNGDGLIEFLEFVKLMEKCLC